MPVRVLIDGEIKIVGRGAKPSPLRKKKKADAAPAEAPELAADVAESAEEANE